MNLSSSREVHRKERAVAETNRICLKYDSLCKEPIKLNLSSLTKEQMKKFMAKEPAQNWFMEE